MQEQEERLSLPLLEKRLDSLGAAPEASPPRQDRKTRQRQGPTLPRARRTRTRGLEEGGGSRGEGEGGGGGRGGAAEGEVQALLVLPEPREAKALPGAL